MHWLTLLHVLVLTIVSSRASLTTSWNHFKERFGKIYMSSEDELTRRDMWYSNVRHIEDHNREADLGLRSYRLAVNKYADMTIEEFLGEKTGLKTKSKGEQLSDTQSHSYTYISDVPSTIDWRTEGYVTSVKDQANCGSCYAFSALGALEGQWFKKTGNLQELSPQNVVDCSKSTGNLGCLGGDMDYTFDYIKNNKGINAESIYPYRGTEGGCQYDASNVAATVTGYVDVEYGSETALKEAVGSIGPVSVGIQVMEDFIFYGSGIYSNVNCTGDQLDHAILAVGYGADGTDEYWIVKNSWSTDWGEQGYAKMARNRDNNCGIANDASYPLVS